MRFYYNDGGRAAAGYKGKVGDCVVRAIAIATGLPYKLVHDELTRRKTARAEKKGLTAYKAATSVDHGVHKDTYTKYLTELGWTWHPTMGIGTGCRVHLKADELPSGTLIVRLSKHICAVHDGIILDTYDCSRWETRCVYGYWTPPPGHRASLRILRDS